MRSISSERRPAALTRKRAPHSPPPASTRNAVGQPLDPLDRRPASQLAAGQHRLGRERKRRRERADEPLVGHLERTQGAPPEMRLAPVELLDPDLADGVVAVGARALHDARQLGHLLLVPRNQQRPGALDGDAHARRVVGQQPVAAHDELGLERARLGVEAGVQQRRVRLARPGAHVRPRLEQGHAQGELRQLARDRAADHASPDDQDIGFGPARHAREYLVRRWPRPPGRASRRSTRRCTRRRTRPRPRAPRQATRPGRARAGSG